MAQYLPILGWASRYDGSWLRLDLVAGLTVWGLVVPEGIAYANLAGLPAQAGLYTILASLVVYALFGSSRQLVVCATSATAALMGSTVVALHPIGTKEYGAFAAGLVLVVGALFLLFGLAKLGFIAQFLSRPVMDGFVFGLAIFVAVGQLDQLLGVSKGTGDTVEKLWHVLTTLDRANWWDFGVGMLALIALFTVPRFWARAPVGLLVLAGGIALSSVLDLAGHRAVAVVGKLPPGLPSIARPQIGVAALWTLLPAAVGIVLVAYSEALGVAQAFADRHGYEIDPNQELIAFGGANLASGALGGLVACGGMSDSAVNDGAGARSQVSGLVAAAMALVTVLALTPLFQDLPNAVLAALIIHAVSKLMRWTKLKAVLRLSPTEFWLGITALAGVVLIDVLPGLLIAMSASLLLVIYRSSLSSVAVLGELADRPGDYGSLKLNPGATATDGILVLRFDAPLYYANAASNLEAVKKLLQKAVPPIHTMILDLEVQHEFDVTTIEMFSQLIGWLRAKGIELFVVHFHRDLYEQADRDKLVEPLGEDHILPTISAAVDRR